MECTDKFPGCENEPDVMASLRQIKIAYEDMYWWYMECKMYIIISMFIGALTIKSDGTGNIKKIT